MDTKVKVIEKIQAATGGAIVTCLLTTPFDVIKTRMQAQTVIAGFPADTLETFGGDRSALQNRLVQNTRSGLFKIARYEGVGSLWRGLPSTLMIALPSTVIYYLGYEHFKTQLSQVAVERCYDSAVLHSLVPFAAGTISRVVAATAISPMEILRTRQQSGLDGKSIAKSLQSIVKLVKTDGVLSLWRGLVPTLWRDVPFSGIYWMGYEYFIKLFENSNVSKGDSDILSLCKNPKFWHSFGAGAISGVIAAALTTPFDVVKTLRQVDYSKSNTVNYQISKETKNAEILKQIYSRDGFSGLFRGLSARLIKVGPACAIMISSYEFGKLYFSTL